MATYGVDFSENHRTAFVDMPTWLFFVLVVLIGAGVGTLAVMVF